MKETSVDSPKLLHIFLQWKILQENWNHLQEEEIEREGEGVRKIEGVCWRYLVQRHSRGVGHDHSADGGTDVVKNSSISPCLSSGEQRAQNLVVLAGNDGNDK